MTSVTDSIINSVVLLIVVIFLGALVIGFTLQNMRLGGEGELGVFVEEQTSHAIDSFLLSTVSGVTMSSLLAQAMFDLRMNISVNNTQVDVIEESENRLSILFGEDNYYFSLEPVIKGVNLMFVFDVSASTQNEIAVIKDNLAFIQEEIQTAIREQGVGDENVYIQIFMLPGSPDRCLIINELALPNTECILLSADIMYGALLDEDWVFPAFGLSSFEEWNRITHYASVDTFAQSDWAAGTAYAALYFDNDAFLQSQANINVIFPMSDELSTSSKADECFLRESVSEFIICQLCESGCPGSADIRSEQAMQQAVTLIESLNTNSRVFPIFSVTCEFAYDSGYNQFSYSSNPLISQYHDGTPFDPQEYPEVSWCSQDSCDACSQSPVGSTNVCFQDGCWAALQEQMGVLASSTQGTILNVNQIDTIPEQLVDSFEETIESFNFTVGVRDDSRNRYVHEKIVQLPNGFLTKVRLWVYQE